MDSPIYVYIYIKRDNCAINCKKVFFLKKNWKTNIIDIFIILYAVIPTKNKQNVIFSEFVIHFILPLISGII